MNLRLLISRDTKGTAKVTWTCGLKAATIFARATREARTGLEARGTAGLEAGATRTSATCSFRLAF